MDPNEIYEDGTRLGFVEPQDVFKIPSPRKPRTPIATRIKSPVKNKKSVTKSDMDDKLVNIIKAKSNKNCESRDFYK